MKWSAPDSKVENLHEDESKHNVEGQEPQETVLFPSNRQPRVHEQQAGLDSPYCETLTLLHNQHKFTSIFPRLYIRTSERVDIEAGR